MVTGGRGNLQPSAPACCCRKSAQPELQPCALPSSSPRAPHAEETDTQTGTLSFAGQGGTCPFLFLEAQMSC